MDLRDWECHRYEGGSVKGSLDRGSSPSYIPESGMRLLIVEDDQRIASYLQKGLHEAGFVTDHAANGDEGLDYAISGDYAVAIVDIMLPRMDGISMIEHLRAHGSQVPVLILSARNSVDDRVKGLQCGGDDYLIKPFAFSELIARIQVLIRRSHPGQDASILKMRDLSVDLVRRRVKRNGVVIELQPREFELLVFLMQNAGRVVSKTMIMENVWDYNFDPQTNVVESRICRLRDKLDRCFDEPYIHTVRGVGYKLEYAAVI